MITQAGGTEASERASLRHGTDIARDGSEGRGGFDAIGTPQERAPLVLRDLQSYDEMALSALLGMSVRTPFINRGGRKNMGVEEKERQPYGIYTGCGHAHNPLSCHNPLSRGEQKRGVCQ